MSDGIEAKALAAFIHSRFGKKYAPRTVEKMRAVLPLDLPTTPAAIERWYPRVRDLFRERRRLGKLARMRENMVRLAAEMESDETARNKFSDGGRQLPC